MCTAGFRQEDGGDSTRHDKHIRCDKSMKCEKYKIWFQADKRYLRSAVCMMVLAQILNMA